MIISVNKECMNFISQVGLTTGEYNAHELEFKFTPDYNNLIKFAIFQNGEKIYKVKVENDKVVIPWEVLEDEGNLYIGVYAYETEGNNLKLRYSPKPIQTNVSKGSFIENGSNTEPLTPTDKEVIFSELNNIDLKTKQLSDGVEIEMTNPKGVTTRSVIYNGKKGKDGQDYVITEEDYKAIADEVESEIKIPTKTSELENDSNFVSNTDYATDNTGGVIKSGILFGTTLRNDGKLQAILKTYEQYSDPTITSTYCFISKGTLENVLANYTTFDTAERAIGSYFGDTIYRKCIKLTKADYNALTTASSRKVLPLNTNIKSILKADMITNYNDGTKVVTKNYPMHLVNTGNAYDQGCHIYENGSLQIYVGSTILNGLIGDINIVLEYTKTTD